MAGYPDNEVKLVNAALSAIGADSITSFLDGSVAGKVMDGSYELIVRAALTSNRWRFATKKAALIRLATPPAETYDTALALPSDCILLHSVSVQETGLQISYDVFGTEVHCNLFESDTPIADYTWRVDEALFPPPFAAYLVAMLASRLSVAVARDDRLAESYAREASLLRAQAAVMEAQGKTARRLDLSAVRRVRMR